MNYRRELLPDFPISTGNTLHLGLLHTAHLLVDLIFGNCVSYDTKSELQAGAAAQFYNFDLKHFADFFIQSNYRLRLRIIIIGTQSTIEKVFQSAEAYRRSFLKE